ncbi:MAG: hypothetical protein ACLQUY_06410 [Ktedonobacterales bacterium]
MQASTTSTTITVPVYSLNFATCGQTIERRLGALPGVLQVDANYVTQTVHRHLRRAPHERRHAARPAPGLRFRLR